MDSTENINPIIEVTTAKDGISATDKKGNKYKIESMILGMGAHRKAIKYTKGSLLAGNQFKAEILPNGKLKIL